MTIGYDEAMRRFSEITLTPVPIVFSRSNPSPNDEAIYALLVHSGWVADKNEGEMYEDEDSVATYADMVRAHSRFTMEPPRDADLTFPKTSMSLIRDKASYTAAVNLGFVVRSAKRRLTHERLKHRGHGRTWINVADAGANGAMTFDEARSAYSRFTVCAPGTNMRIDFDRRMNQDGLAFMFFAISALPGARLTGAKPLTPLA
jgi:hypothetical protein